jgi:hypothetical protein
MYMLRCVNFLPSLTSIIFFHCKLAPKPFLADKNIYDRHYFILQVFASHLTKEGAVVGVIVWYLDIQLPIYAISAYHH